MDPKGLQSLAATSAKFKRNRVGISGRPVDLPGRKAFAFLSQDGVSVYENASIKAAPGGRADEIGHRATLVSLPLLNRTLVNSDAGVFEIRPDNSVHRLTTPFTTGGLPMPVFTQNARNGVVLILAKGGLFAADPDLKIEHVPGLEGLKFDFGDRFVGEVPDSGDHLLEANNALYLVTSPRSPRWCLCRAALASRQD